MNGYTINLYFYIFISRMNLSVVFIIIINVNVDNVVSENIDSFVNFASRLRDFAEIKKKHFN